jgi:GH15 family glucan-1,4-alpha-glucosidase
MLQLLIQRLHSGTAESERGDVPGWVLVTIMTAALVVALFAIASPLLGNVFSRAVNAVDGLTGREGVFLPCSFWLVNCLHLIGRKKDARELFERLLTVRNDLGLLSEEYDPREKRLLGNFPQAFSHVALVNTARVLSEE